MGMLSQLLAGVNDGGTEFVDGLKWLVVVLVSIAGSLCIIYAIYIGYLFATATDDGKRRAAKERLIKVLSSLLIIFALAMCLTVIDVRFTTPEQDGGKTDEGTSLDDLQKLEVSAFIYKESLSWWLTTTTPEVSFRLKPGSLGVTSGAEIANFDNSKVRFTTVSLVGLPTAFANRHPKPIDNSNPKYLEFFYTVPTAEQAPADSTRLPYWNKNGDSKNKYWKALAQFTYDEMPYSVEIWIKVTSPYWDFSSTPSA